MFKLNPDFQIIAKLELIPNDIIQQDIEETNCYSCGRSKDVFWSNIHRAMLCTECDKVKGIIRKMGADLIDNGITIEEFTSRLIARTEIYGD